VSELASTVLAWGILVTAGTALSGLLVLALHRLHLLRRARSGAPRERDSWEGPLPRVTVQIPVFNEAAVVQRVLDAAAQLDYPPERLQIQLLDDSTDDTTSRAARRIEHWRNRGVRIEHVRRPDRMGYKAGALQQGLKRATGAFILVLDADFVPPPDLVRRLLPPFSDDRVGMVQARWDHLNEKRSLLTRCQALLLDAHFFFEQGGRYAAGRFMNFNGTAGMWRRRTLDEVGGWSWDTLTEDLDVSYRAQMAGWRFVFLPTVGVPAEIPDTVRALEVQQKRWAQGGVQTGRKILPRLLRSPWPWPVKLEGAAHLLSHLAHPLTLCLGLLLLPSAVARSALGLERLLVLDLLVFAGATGSFILYYTAAGRMRRRTWGRVVPDALWTLALGIGLTAPVSRAVLRGLAGGNRDPFLRTPKRGDGGSRYRSPDGWGDRVLQGFMAFWMVGGAGIALAQGYLATLPFLVLFGTGYTWLFVGGLTGEGGDGWALRPGRMRGRKAEAAGESASSAVPASPGPAG
jgi:cellulose synthase/poly-beta-1,6-N-acetylglucosamine synthase-like glycosyltransferase